MLFAIPAEKYVLNPVIEQAMNQIPVLHADHGQCARPLRCAAGRTYSPASPPGWRRCGGRCMAEQMNRACECWRRLSVDQVPGVCAVRGAIRRHFAGWVLATRATVVTRAPISRETSHRVLAEVGMSDRLLQVAMALEDVALTDPYFVDNGLSPSVDFIPR